MKVFTREEIYKIDQSVVDIKVPLIKLLDSVGKSLCEWFRENTNKNQSVLILIGPGNNGADGLALAKHLKLMGYNVSTINPNNNSAFPTEIKTLPLDTKIEQFDIIVDALFGIGLNKDITGPFADLITAANQSHSKRISIDIPSGVNCNSGQLYKNYFKADHTLCIGGYKPGVLLSPGREACGKISIIDVPILSDAMNSSPTRGQILSKQSFVEFSPKPEDNKYTRGVVAICLSKEYPGAALLAAHAAQKTGAGYVMVFCPTDLVQECQIQHPDLVFKSYNNQTELNSLITNETFDSLLIGSGWESIPKDFSFELPLQKMIIFDGGFLKPNLLKHSGALNPANTIITPHLGELRRLTESDDKSTTKWTLVHRLIKKFNGTVIAKGYDTLIAQDDKYYVTSWNSPSLAVAGSGDILCGILATMAAKTKSSIKASCLAVDLHRQLAIGKNSITPLELLENISQTIND